MRQKVVSRELLDTNHGGGSWWAMKLACGHEAMFRHNGSAKRSFPKTMECSAASALKKGSHCGDSRE